MKKKGPISSPASSSSDEDMNLILDVDTDEKDELTTAKGKDDEMNTTVDISEAEYLQLVNGFASDISKFEEFSIEFVSNKIHHPVISCFRELSGSDITFILANSNKLRRRMVALEQGVTYLGLIDFLASITDNALYVDEKQKGIRKIPNQVTKLLMELKGVIGPWGLQKTGKFKKRYEIVMRFLHQLIPRFNNLVGFGESFAQILQTFEQELAKNLQNSEMIQAMSNTNTNGKNHSKLKPAIAPTQSTRQSSENNSDLTTNIQNRDPNLSMDISNYFENNEITLTSTLRTNDPKLNLSQSLTHCSQLKTNANEMNKRKKTELELSQEPVFVVNAKQDKIQNAPRISQPKNLTLDGPPFEAINISSLTNDRVSSPRKKPRLTTENIENEAGRVQNKVDLIPIAPKTQPKVNAFALLMNRSKELAMLSKQKKKKSK